MQPPQETYHDSFLEYPDLDEQSSSPAAYYELTFGEGSQTSSDSAFRDNLQLEGMSFPDPGLNEPLSHNVPSTPFGYVDYTPTLQDARGYSDGANLPERYLQHDPQTSSLADPALAPSRQSSYPSCSPLLVAAPPERLGSVIMFGPPGFFERMLSSFDVNEYNGEDLGILNDDDHPSITQTCSQSGSNSTADTPEGNPKRSFYPRPRNLLLGKVASIYFRTKSGRIGIRAVDALNERYEGLVGKNKVANLGDSRTASAVIEVPGYKRYARQFKARNWRKPPNNKGITVTKLAGEIAKSLKRFKVEAVSQDGSTGCPDVDLNLDSTFILGLRRISRASWIVILSSGLVDAPL